ncbi:MAG: leucyl/phenylalanyl-tRNA--protein transferase [Armatimonadetes bacterium]|nr:leucyl/phenylalanyl-tRNA--protein transferase [Armatimonadota bacterium]
MADDYGSIAFYRYDPRAVLFPEEFHCPRRLQRLARRPPYEIRLNTAAEEVIRGCAERPRTWISTELVTIYVELHRRGLVHSLEAWRSGRLCGGLYGVALGGIFCGESMFARAPDASKICLVHLVERLKQRGYLLLDCQQETAHMARFGARAISGREYQVWLQRALELDRSFV